MNTWTRYIYYYIYLITKHLTDRIGIVHTRTIQVCSIFFFRLIDDENEHSRIAHTLAHYRIYYYLFHSTLFKYKHNQGVSQYDIFHCHTILLNSKLKSNFDKYLQLSKSIIMNILFKVIRMLLHLMIWKYFSCLDVRIPEILSSALPLEQNTKFMSFHRIVDTTCIVWRWWGALHINPIYHFFFFSMKDYEQAVFRVCTRLCVLCMCTDDAGQTTITDKVETLFMREIVLHLIVYICSVITLLSEWLTRTRSTNTNALENIDWTEHAHRAYAIHTICICMWAHSIFTYICVVFGECVHATLLRFVCVCVAIPLKEHVGELLYTLFWMYAAIYLWIWMSTWLLIGTYVYYYTFFSIRRNNAASHFQYQQLMIAHCIYVYIRTLSSV